MGNVHAFNHRITAISMACLASAGVLFCFLSGFSCNYLAINALSERSVMTPEGLKFEGQSVAHIGIQCDSPFYDEKDRMWNLSQVFLYVGLSLGGLTTLLAWALSTIVTPTNLLWRTMSILAACTAVLMVPIFLIFESEPCNMDINRQTCSLAAGGYFNIASVGLFIVMTLWTQCLNPPDWTKETGAWRNSNREVKVSEITIPGGEDHGTDEESLPQGDGPIFIASENARPAVWRMGSGHRAEILKEMDMKSEVSSISRANKEADSSAYEDIEIAPPPDVNRNKSILDGDGNDRDIRRGAAVVINTLRDKTQSLRKSFQRQPRTQAAPSSATVSPRACTSIGTMRKSALADSEYSAVTGDDAGIKVTIICPDGRKEKVGSSMPSCADGQQLLVDAQETLNETAEFVRNASKLTKKEEAPTQPTSAYRSGSGDFVLTHSIRPDDEDVEFLAYKYRSMNSAQHTAEGGAPLASFSAPTDFEYDEVSEMTSGVSEVAPVRKKGNPRDTLSILEDLARLED